jgi:hypothetical protein
MIKKKLVWILSGVAVLVIVALILFLPQTGSFAAGKTKASELPEGQAILCNAYPELKSVQKGDAFLYVLEVLYDTNQISGIDSVTLDSNVNLSPFEIRETTDVEFSLDSDTRVFQRQYEIQLINGDVDELYTFPTIVVRYKLQTADGYAETSVLPESVYVSPRLPDNVMVVSSDTQLNYESLRSVEGEIESSGQSSLSWILWITGALLAMVALTDLTLRYVYKGNDKTVKTSEDDLSELIGQSYCSLRENIQAGAKPSVIFHRIDHILRLVMIQKENNSWLSDADFDRVSFEIKPVLLSLFEKCQMDYEEAKAGSENIEEALKQLEEILEFYFGEEMGAWKS